MKTLVVLGDSITKGTYTAVGQDAPFSIANPNYATLVKEAIGADVLFNYGTNGISYSSLSPVMTEEALTKTCATREHGDVIIVAAGTNDFGTDVPLGTLSDREDISFCGAVDVVLCTLKKNNPTAEIYVILPTPRKDDGKNKAGFTLDEYREALKAKANSFGVHVIDGRLLPIDPKKEEDKMNYIYDGTHLNEAGHELYAKLIVKEITFRKI